MSKSALIEKGAYLDATNINRKTPLHLAREKHWQRSQYSSEKYNDCIKILTQEEDRRKKERQDRDRDDDLND